MYQALYRKYRPATFEDVCGHQHITAVLQGQVNDEKTSHAYLFCGARGTGKTSCAKILAKAVNCLSPVNGSPCNCCDACQAIDKGTTLDVVEMDAASNNSVENIRKLCDDVQYLPTEVKKRVYIVDEVHMLSISAFNALLKTLEEPPAHVLFILATTDVNKVPATIVSRCQRFDFRRIPSQVIVDRLMQVAGKENMDLTREAARILAKISDGGMRDALSLLEACTMVQGTIDAPTVTRILGLSDRELILDLIEAVCKKNPARATHLVDELYQKNGDFKDVISEILKLYRDLLVLKFVPTPDSFVDCYQEEAQRLSEVASTLTKDELLYHVELLENLYADYDRIHSGKKATVEIAFMRLCFPELSQSAAALAARISQLEAKLAQGAPIPRESLPEAQTQTQRPDPVAEPSEDVAPAPVRPAQAKPQSTPTAAEPPYVEDLRIRMQEENLIRPYLKQVQFVQKGSTLYVLTSDFIKGVLQSIGCDAIIKRHVASLDSSVQSVVISEKIQQNTPSNGDGLDDF